MSPQVTSPFLSIVIPAYNEERRILATLQQVTAHLARQSYEAEVLVIDDGSTDGTRRLVQGFAAEHPVVTLVHNPHRGKGYAVRTGMLAARGGYRFQCDADLAMPIEELARFLPPQRDHFDVAVGSREGQGARRYGEPPYRHFMGRVFNLAVRTLAVRGLADTQCGFKCFRGEVAEAVFSTQRIFGFGSDVEILFIAQKRGLNIVEVPIPWYHQRESKVRPVQDTAAMLLETFQVRLNDLRGLYG
ncbi:MAG: glycosyltransferase family 2 protein [Dehalococcoidia bacterium]|nr:glycosyltransferase family 2 protein [Dehalococcoidia bacterium]